MDVNCATAGIDAYVPNGGAPWNTARVQHLYRRLGYGASHSDIQRALAQSPAATVDALIDQAAARPLPDPPVWADWTHEQFVAADQEPFEAFKTYMTDFVDRGIEYGVREKLTLFWHGHFVTKYESHSCPSYHHQYWTALTEGTFGNFRDFVLAITRTPAMLFYLNGFENRRESPNENYARELFELFTLGENNGYTQNDITEASRALTGWNQWTAYCGEVKWADWGHDNTSKTIFGRSGNYDDAALVDLLFEERADDIAGFVCEKLYRAFVNPNVDSGIVQALATTFVAADFELLPVYRQLFRSAHFFHAANLGVQIKTPLEMMSFFLREGAFGDFENRKDWGIYGIATLGQYLGEPPDVAGWPGGRSWIDSNRLTLRWEFMDGFTWAVHNEDQTTYPTWAKQLTDESRDPAVITRAIADFFVPRGLASEAAYTTAVTVLRWEVPANYYETGQWSLDWDSASWQITLLLRHLCRLPEFHLT
ncbi:MAG: DUF1800 domain-containing protein [Lewinella sp.]